ncbi:hypothetical protein PF004_g18068 [Phytophthora fragariae]|uniref:Uncharacterized protein n=1 Tax=Phytophthora fragariae TaxID=53985 RepID=A0A6G0NDM0_9STRA|nr:hypothetical protein PF004_g18068 [Phytophthora fragariae]
MRDRSSVPAAFRDVAAPSDVQDLVVSVAFEAHTRLIVFKLGERLAKRSTAPTKRQSTELGDRSEPSAKERVDQQRQGSLAQVEAVPNESNQDGHKERF